MAAPVAMEHPDLTDLSNTPGQKRKRASESASPDSRRNKQRGVPPATMAVPEPEAFLENAVSIAQAAHDHVSADDFNALAQAASDHTDTADANSATNTAAAALNMYPTLHVPPPTEETFAPPPPGPEMQHHDENAYHNPSPVQQPDGLPPMTPQTSLPPPNGVQPEPPKWGTPMPPNKPAVGSEEWHKMRKDNHKEVERRRRETINEGINELAKIVPGCEKNKGSILQRAVQFITQLKENETQNIEKWTLEKLLTEQAIQELSQSNDKLKQEVDRLYREKEMWKSIAESAGLQPPQPKEEPEGSS